MLLGVQTYTVRKDAKRDLDSTLKRIQALGVNHVELARIKFNQQNAQIVSNSKIAVVSIQVTFAKLNKRFAQIVAFCNKVECDLVVVSVLPVRCMIGKEKALVSFSNELNKLAKRYLEQGIKLAFHHHDFEFVKIGNAIKLDYLLAKTDRTVKFVMDTYWVVKAGYNPVEIAKKFGDRLIGLHLRDHRQLTKGKKTKSKDCEVGEGTIDFLSLLNVVRPYVNYGAIEQNSKTPWESLKQSIAYCQTGQIQNQFPIKE